MRSNSLLLLAATLGIVVGDDFFGRKLTTEASQKKGRTQYQFHYFVKDDTTGDYKAQEETKQGDLVHGSYTLAEPNGDLRTVKYKAGPGKGFEAKVDVSRNRTQLKLTTKETPVSEITTASENLSKTEKPITVESTVKTFEGGFKMDVISKPQPDIKTEMGMKFSMETNSATAPVTASSNAEATFETTITEKSQTTLEVAKTTNPVSQTENVESSAVENSTLPPEGRDIGEDEIEKEIDKVINSMPEFILPDNKTRFKFHKDPEEALLDERITQIARQLAEISLRREYEERKLGHFLPISVSPVEPSTTTYLSKSFKYAKNIPSFRPREPSTLHVLTQLKIIPQYIHRQTTIPNLYHLNYRLPVASKPTQETKPWEIQIQETITNTPDILKINNFENKKKDMKTMTPEEDNVSVVPFQVPTFLQFFTPYVMHSPGSYIRPIQPHPQLHTSTVKRDLTMKEVPVTDKTISARVTMPNNNNTDKS